MAWQYDDFEEQDTDAEVLAQLKRHITEVNGAISADVSADNRSRSSHPLVSYLQILTDRRKELEASPSSAQNGGTSFVRRRRPE